MDGTAIPELLTAILQLMPLDPAVAAPCFTMGMMAEHVSAGWVAPIKDEYKRLVAESAGAPVAFAEVRGGGAGALRRAPALLPSDAEAVAAADVGALERARGLRHRHPSSMNGASP